MAAKSLKIDSLEFDLQNPRIPLASDQRDAIQKIVDEQGVKLVNLAESIAARGLSPMDRIVVVGSPIREGKFIVLEGNRRILCAKFLKKPALIPTLNMRDSAGTDGVARIVLESVQELLLKLALQLARDDYETRRERQRQGVQLARTAGKYAGRVPDTAAHERIIALRAAGHTIHKTASLTACSPSQVKRIWAIHLHARPKPVQ